MSQRTVMSLRRTHRHAVMAVVVALVCIAARADSVRAQSISVPEMLEQKSDWKKWSEEGRKLQLNGRFEGRAGKSFRLQRLEITFDPPRGLTLPQRMRAGQRLEMSGRLTIKTGRFHFELSRLAVGETDDRRIDARAAKIGQGQPDLLLNLASEYEVIADFYDDDPLRERIDSVRRRAFEEKRVLAAGNPQGLSALLKAGPGLGIDERELAAIRFETLVARRNKPDSILPELARSIEQTLEGWDKPQGADATISAEFLSDPVQAYRTARDPERLVMHRAFYRLIQKEIFESKLKSDGSNGIALANQIRVQLPEEEQTARTMEQKEIEYRLGRVKQLNRQQLQQLVDLLAQYERNDQIAETLDRWLKQQQEKFKRIGLSGKIRTADEYLFVGERWRIPRYNEEAVRLLKEAWTIAAADSPDDAAQIAERLRRLGWERMHDRWMTAAEIRGLPRDDIELAIREGRVVQGMSPSQVSQTLGSPIQVSRLASAVSVYELWSYGDSSGGGLVVRFRRSPREKTAAARVVSVSGTTMP